MGTFGKIFFAFVVLSVAFIVRNFFDVLEINKTISHEINAGECQFIRGAAGVEDLVKYKHYLIGSSDDKLRLWELPQYGFDKTPNGGLVYIDTTAQNQQIIHAEIINFPHDVAFHPHGIYLYQNTFLYVISHAYSKGGERIEVFQVNDENGKLSFLYLRSIKVSSEYNGILNDLVVVGDDDEIFVTTYLPFADPIEGRSHSVPIFLLTMFTFGLKLPLTNTLYCKGPDGNCSVVPLTKSLQNNGITFDGVNTIYNNALFERKIRVYTINPTDRSKLDFQRDIPIPYVVDNVEYDRETGVITAGLIGKIVGHFQFVSEAQKIERIPDVGAVDNWGGSLTIDTRNGDRVDVPLLARAKLYGVSSSLRVNDHIYLGSWCDDGMLKCRVVN